MDEHVLPLLQGAAQPVAVQLASYGNTERQTYYAPASHMEAEHAVRSLINDADFLFGAAFDMNVAHRTKRLY